MDCMPNDPIALARTIVEQGIATGLMIVNFSSIFAFQKEGYDKFIGKTSNGTTISSNYKICQFYRRLKQHLKSKARLVCSATSAN